MKYQVPQFIDVEDKIFGPLTFKQFIYLAGGAGLVFILYSIFPFFIAILFIIPVGALAIALAFYKVNNKPFIFVMASALKYLAGSKLYIWKKRVGPRPIVPGTKKKFLEKGEIENEQYIPKLSDSKLKEMSWSLGIKDSIYSEQENNKNAKFKN